MKKKTLKTKSKSKLTDIKPIVKDGYHYRWYYHLPFGWTIVDVGPWDNYQCCFNRAGFPEEPKHWVKNTYPWQWGPKIPDLDPSLMPNIPKWVHTDNERVIKTIQKIRSSEKP